MGHRVALGLTSCIVPLDPGDLAIACQRRGEASGRSGEARAEVTIIQHKNR